MHKIIVDCLGLPEILLYKIPCMPKLQIPYNFSYVNPIGVELRN